MIGDSNLESISRQLISVFDPNIYRITSMKSSACYFIPNSFSAKNGEPHIIPHEPCDTNFQNLRLAELAKSKNNILIIGGLLDVYLTSIQRVF